MITVDPAVLAIKTDGRRYALYEQMQEELCNVIEFMGGSPSKENSHQFYGALEKICLESPRKWSLEFQCTPRKDPVEVWNSTRITRLLENFQLDPIHNWAVTFRLSHFTQYIDNSHSEDAWIGGYYSPTAPFCLDYSQVITLIYQDKIGTWLSSLLTGNDSFGKAVVGSDRLSLISLPSSNDSPNGTLDETKFHIGISPSGYLSVISSSFCFLRPTRLVFSHFHAMRRPS